MKLSTRLLMKMLRLYDIADDDASAKSFRNVEILPHETFVRASLIFDGIHYAFLYGSTVDESELKLLWPTMPDNAEPLANPMDEESYTTPFQGKYLMVFKLNNPGQRLDIYLSTEFNPDISRSLWQKYIKSGYVTVNGEQAPNPKFEVRPEDVISVDYPSEAKSERNIPVIYQDEDVIVIDKPAGVLTHAKGGISQETTVADFFRDKTSFAEETDRPGIVHRLDRDTSGVLVGARNDKAMYHLQEQFASRKAKKVYLAVVQGRPKLDEAKIDLPIARHPQRPSTFRVDAQGKPAQTTYKVLAESNGQSLVRLEPRTGRTHQLRVHMAHIGTPIVGDRVYGKESSRLMLHAWKLSLSLPTTGDKTFEAAIPEGFVDSFPEAKL